MESLGRKCGESIMRKQGEKKRKEKGAVRRAYDAMRSGAIAKRQEYCFHATT
jgi:hypothetical protein